MTKGAYSQVESPEARTPRLSKSGINCVGTGCARPLYNILRFCKPPNTKYRRPSEGRRDSFGGGLCLQDGQNHIGMHPSVYKSIGQCIDKSADIGGRTTSKAISRRYPLTGDCSRKAVLMRFDPNGQHRKSVSRVDSAGAFTRAVPIGRCFSQFDRNSGCFNGGPSVVGHRFWACHPLVARCAT